MAVYRTAFLYMFDANSDFFDVIQGASEVLLSQSVLVRVFKHSFNTLSSGVVMIDCHRYKEPSSQQAVIIGGYPLRTS